MKICINFYKGSQKIILLVALCGGAVSGHAQKASFTATIGFYTYNVKDGDVLRICEGGTIDYTSTATGYTKLTWNYDDGAVKTTGAINFSVTYSSTGSNFYTEQIVNEGLAGEDKIKVKVVVSPKDPDLKAIIDYDPKTTECGSSAFTFDGKNSTGTGLSYHWDFGDGNVADTKTATHSFNTAVGAGGTQDFTVTLTVTNNDGCTDTDTKTITIKKIPDGTITSPDTDPNFITGIFNGLTAFSYCNTSAVSGSFYKFKFKNASTTASTNQSYTIKWGDGTSPDSTNFSWAFDEIIEHDFPFGNSIMTVQVKGPAPDNCISETRYNIFVGSKQFIGTLFGASDICTGEDYSFEITNYLDDPPGTIYKYIIPGLTDTVFFDPNISSTQFVNLQTSSCGQPNNVWEINVFAQNACGSTVAKTDITVSDKPKAIISLSPDVIAICNNTQLTLSNTSDYGNEITGDAGSGFNCNAASGVKQAWTISPSTGYIIISGALGTISGNVITVSGSKSLILNFSSNGTYTFKLFVSNAKCGVDTISRTICVQDKPVADFQLTGIDANNCFSETITLKNNTVNGLCLSNTYTWSIKNDSTQCSNGNDYIFVNGTDNNSVSPDIWFKQAGYYKISLEAAASETCKDDITKTFILKDTPRISLSNIGDICAGNTISPKAIITDCFGGGITNPQWSFPNGVPGSSNQIDPGDVLYTTIGNQTITFTAQNSCGSSTASQTFKVTDKPPADAGPPTEFCSGSSAQIGVDLGSGYTYEWTPSRGLSNASVPRPIVTLTYTGTSADTVIYKVKVSQGSNCDSTDNVRVIVKQSPSVTVLPTDKQICEGESVLFKASGAESYEWSPSTFLNTDKGNTVISTPPSSITYTVKGSIANGCGNTATASVIVNQAATADAGSDDSLCNNSSIKLGNNSGSFSYEWYPQEYLDDPLSANPVFSPTGFTKDTTIKFKVIAKAGAGCEAEDSVLIQVKQSPIVSINPDKPSVCVGDTIKITASGADDYQWKPNEFISNVTGKSVNIYPPSTTIYTVTGTNINGCNNEMSFTVTVNPDAIAAFVPSSYTNCAAYNLDTVIIPENHPAENSNYTWYIKDKTGTAEQSFSTALSPDYVLKNPGDSVTVYLTASSKYGCKDSTTPTAIFKAGNAIKALFSKSSDGGCEPQNISFTNTSSILDVSVSFNWDFGNGNTSNEIQPAAQTYISGDFSRDTTYYITLKAQIACGIDSVKDSVKINPKPIARFGTDSSTSGCSPYYLQFKNTSAGNVDSFYWDFDDGYSFKTNRDTSVSHLFITSDLDTFNVKLFAYNKCGTDSLLLPIVVAPNTIEPQVTTYGNDLYGCVPPEHTVNFVNNTTGALTSLWNFGDGTGAGLPGNIVNVSHTYSTPGTYPVTVSFANGCSKGLAAQTVVIYPAAEAAFNVIDSTSNIFCYGDSVYLDITKQTGDYNYLYWGDDGLFYSPPVSSHYYKDLGTYKITLIAERINSIGTVCSDTAYDIVRIAERPLVSAAALDTIDCFTDRVLLTASGGVDYVWLPNSNLSNNNASTTFAYPDTTTTYTVKITAASGCAQERKVIVPVNKTISPGQDPFSMPTAFTPNGDRLNDCFGLKYKDNIEPGGFSLRVFNRWGQIIFETTNPNECWDGKLNSFEQPSGTYVWIMSASIKCPSGLGGEIMPVTNRKGTVVLIR